MQITIELLKQDIAATETQFEQLKTQAAQVNGSLATLKGMLKYLEQDAEKVPSTPSEPEPQPKVTTQDKHERKAVKNG